jgi:7-cyano-7-deazaguanine synthase
MEAQVILFGANAEEAERFPDNSEAFRERVNAELEFSTLNHPRVECPMGHLDKARIVDRAVALNVPLQHIWSCYTDMEAQCGQCPSCYRLRQALRNASAGSVYRDKLSFRQ